MTEQQVRDKLIEAGVKNLKAFGYKNVNATNILTDRVFKQFFVGMLQDNCNAGRSHMTDKARGKLLAELGIPAE